MQDSYVEPIRGKLLHLVRPGLATPGATGVYRTACGRNVHATVLSRGDEPTLRLCSSCRRRGNP